MFKTLSKITFLLTNNTNISRMRKFLTLVLLLAGFTAFAQQHTVKGTVTDQNGQPVIGMAVFEQGTQNGTVTDENGNYSIAVSSPDGALEFNSLGYSTVVEQIAGRAVINVESSEEAIALDAVVAIGYGSVKKADLTTAVSTVSTEDMKLRPVTEASGFIQGKVAGVQVQQTSGLPGGGMTVRIRGAPPSHPAMILSMWSMASLSGRAATRSPIFPLTISKVCQS